MTSRRLRVDILPYADASDLLHLGMVRRQERFGNLLKALFPADFLQFRFRRGPTEPSNDMSRSELLAGFEATAAGSEDPSVWYVQVLIADSFRSSPELTYGLMWDTSDRTRSRRGCAIFAGPIFQKFHDDIDRLRMLARTTAHEIGHTLNLCHSDVDGARDSLMRPDAQTPADLANPRFSAGSLEHILDAPVDVVRPGSAVAYGDRSRCDHPGHLQRHCADCDTRSSRTPRFTAQLGLKIHGGLGRRKGRLPVLVLGEPLSLCVKVRNAGKKTFSVVEEASTWNGEFSVFHRTPGSIDFEHLTAPMSSCGAASQRMVKLAPGKSHLVSELLAHRRGKPPLVEIGRHEIVAKLRTTRGWISSDIVRFEVLAPETSRHRHAVELATNPDVSLFIESGGYERAPSTRERVERMIRINPAFPAAAPALVALAKSANTAASDVPKLLRKARRCATASSALREEATVRLASWMLRNGKHAQARRCLAETSPAHFTAAARRVAAEVYRTLHGENE